MSAIRFVTAIGIVFGLPLFLVNPHHASATDATIDEPVLLAIAPVKAADIGPWQTVVMQELATSNPICDPGHGIDVFSASCEPDSEPASNRGPPQAGSRQHSNTRG